MCRATSPPPGSCRSRATRRSSTPSTTPAACPDRRAGNIRLVRPAPPGACGEQVLPVNLAAIIEAGDPTTNYQLLPGDRLVVPRDEKAAATRDEPGPGAAADLADIGPPARRRLEEARAGGHPAGWLVSSPTGPPCLRRGSGSPGRARASRVTTARRNRDYGGGRLPTGEPDLSLVSSPSVIASPGASRRKKRPEESLEHGHQGAQHGDCQPDPEPPPRPIACRRTAMNRNEG